MNRTAIRLFVFGCLSLGACAPDRELPQPGAPADRFDTPPAASVLQYHKSATRDGLYVDSAFTHAAAAGLHLDSSFNATFTGASYAQPLYVENGPGGKDVLVVATEHDDVIAFDAADGSVVWTQSLGTPIPLSALPCGNIDPLGVTGTPIVDLASHTVFVDAMTTLDGTSARHLVFALSLDDGSVRSGWPVDVSQAVSGFDSQTQNQRGALTLVNGLLHVPYGGHFGDCGTYHGWVVTIRVDDPTVVNAWKTRADGGGAWAPGGLASDGTATFVATGDTEGASSWADGEAVIRLVDGQFSLQDRDYFAPSNWSYLDDKDLDIGGSGALLMHVAGATPSDLVLALGKDGKAYLLDAQNLGGIGHELASQQVSLGYIINGAAAYTTAQGSYFVFRSKGGKGCPAGQSGDLTAVKIVPGSPPTMQVAWCAAQSGKGSPIVTSTDGQSEVMVWSLGAEGDNQVHGFDGDTGAALFHGVPDSLHTVRRFQTPIVAKGRMFVAADGQLYAYKLN
jgi:hypothetical protein